MPRNKEKPLVAEGRIEAYSAGDSYGAISVRTGPLTDVDRDRLHRLMDEEATVRVTIEVVEKGYSNGQKERDTI